MVSSVLHWFLNPFVPYLSFISLIADMCKQKQFDVNYVDSSISFQALRQQFLSPEERWSFDVEANILSEIDTEGYEAAKLLDADRILHQQLLPMGYPWSEEQPYSAVVKTFPRDIDEMPEILGIEDNSHVPFENGFFGYGKFAVGKTIKSATDQEPTIKYASRRSEDQGVIELTSVESDHELPAISKTQADTPVRQTNGSNKIEDEAPPRRSARKRRSPQVADETRLESEVPNHLLDYYRGVQESKRRKHIEAIGRTKKKFVSVRFGSVSSRKSILKEGNHDEIELLAGSKYKQAALLVKVHLPHEVHAGRNLVLSTAAENATKLGSYDMRYGMLLEKPSKSSNRSRRTTTGRTRLMWTKAHLGAGTSVESVSSRHRLAYSDLLSSNRIDVAQFRRPREVALAVRVNGVRLTHQNQSDSFSPKSVMDRPASNDDETVAAASGLSERTVSAAIAAACGSSSSSKSRRRGAKSPLPATSPQAVDDGKPNQGEPMCFLQSEELLQKLFRVRKAEAAAAKRASKMVETLPGGGKIPTSKGIHFTLPTLDCLPSTDGLIRVVCTAPGAMKPQWVPAILDLGGGEEQSTNCTVCFSADSSESVESCVTCGVRAHLSCCSDKGTRPSDKSSWMCASCSETNRENGFSDEASNSAGRRRKTKAPLRFRESNDEEASLENPQSTSVSSIQCQLCLHSGGAMSPALNTDGYVHEVCRIWTHMPAEDQADSRILQDLVSNPLLNRIRNLCTLCGSRTQDKNNELIRCAASGCRVLFHPMCALLASKIATSEAQGEMPSGKLERLKILDSQLCKQYTLTMMKCTTVSPCGDEESEVRPVAFCGLHNPIRETSLFGCYPCGGLIGEAMRIPSASL
jgi:hypothetical protein